LYSQHTQAQLHKDFLYTQHIYTGYPGVDDNFVGVDNM